VSSPSRPAITKPTRCPICGKEAVETYRPFCSKRCADIDLGKWFSGSYAIAGREDDEDGGVNLPVNVERQDDGTNR
jgi:endogenous inhibitor of DNA gyrase (YacG/DUF329 family)